MPVLDTLEGFFAARAPVSRGDRIAVAFSGGPDSTALLHALSLWSSDRSVSIDAVHLDHALDRGSTARAREAERTAEALGVGFVAARRPVAALRRRGESPEEAARRLRYRFLERIRGERGARYLATAHHRDDQAETVILRLLQGTGTAGLAGIEARRGRLIRPLLALRRAELIAWLEHHDLRWTDDPTNRDLAARRNLVRHRVLSALDPAAADLSADLGRLAGTARRAHSKLDKRLDTLLAPRPHLGGGLEIERRRLESVPGPLLGPALSLLHRRAGRRRAPGAAVHRELARQLAAGGKVGCDCGGGWSLRSEGPLLVLGRQPVTAPAFAYTLAVPGRVELPAGNGALKLSRQAARPWMLRPSSRRVGLSLALRAGDQVTVRTRRPGDRIRPIGCSYDRRLKDVLIDRKVPRQERDQLPLLCVGGRVVWVPGVTVDDNSRLGAEREAWVAEWER